MAQESPSLRKQEVPPVSWDSRTKTFSIVLRGDERLEPGEEIQVQWTPPVTYVVRIREANSIEWSPGFETPLTGCNFVGLRPDTQYEVEIRSKNAHGESEPLLASVRTDLQGRGNL